MAASWPSSWPTTIPSALERIFLWQGDSRILLAITKYVEDKLNVAYDTGVAGVQVILLIEDNIRYYSSFLPTMYTEIINHSQSLITEGVNVAHKILRMRARPKILLCTSFEEAWEYFSAYQEDVLGVISDIEFPQEGRLNPLAGAEFARKVRAACRDIPVLLQSSRPDSEAVAREVGAEFLLKGSPTLLDDLRSFIVKNFAFGDFVFRLPDGTVVGRAKNLKEPARAAAHRPGRVHHLPRRAQRLLPLAEGPHRVPSGPAPPAPHRRRLRRPPRSGGGTSSTRSTPTAASRPGSR